MLSKFDKKWFHRNFFNLTLINSRDSDKSMIGREFQSGQAIKIGIHNYISADCLGIELGTSRSSGTGSKIHII